MFGQTKNRMVYQLACFEWVFNWMHMIVARDFQNMPVQQNIAKIRSHDYE